MAVKTTIVGNRDLSGRFARVVGSRLQRAQRFARGQAEQVSSDWAARTRSSRVAAAITIREGQPSHYVVEATAADVGFNPAFVERDTRPHRIEPTKEHGFLANPETGFFTKGGVNHPGTTGDHSLEETVTALASEYREGLRAIWGGG